MPYIKNKTRDYVRIGVKSRESGEAIIRLEPAEMVERIDPKTKERTVRQGQNVAFVSEEDFRSNQVKRSLGKLFVEIQEEEYEDRQSTIWGQENDFSGFAVGPDGERVKVGIELTQPTVTVDMKDFELEGFAGAAHGTKSAPQNIPGDD